MLAPRSSIMVCIMSHACFLFASLFLFGYVGSTDTASRLMGVLPQSGDSVRLNPWEAATLKALSVWTHLWQPRFGCFCLPLWLPWPRWDCTQSAQYSPGDTCNHKEAQCLTAPQQVGFTEKHLLAEEAITYCIRLMLSEVKLWLHSSIYLYKTYSWEQYKRGKKNKSHSIRENDCKSLYWTGYVTYNIISSCRAQSRHCFNHSTL